MIGVSDQRWFRPALLVSGATLGAVTTGWLVGEFARAWTRLPTWADIGVLLGCAALGVADAVARRALSFPRRQTFSGAVGFAGPRLGHVVWGFDVGLGFTTFRTTRIYWSALMMLVLTGSRSLCFAGVFAYTAVLFWSIMTGRGQYVGEDSLVVVRRRLGVAGAGVAGGLVAVVGL